MIGKIKISFFIIVHIKYLQAFKWCLLNDWKIHIIWYGSNPNWIIIIYLIWQTIPRNFSEGKLLFSEQNRVKLIRSKLMTGKCSIDNFMTVYISLNFCLNWNWALSGFLHFVYYLSVRLTGFPINYATRLIYFLIVNQAVIVCSRSINYKYILSHRALILSFRHMSIWNVSCSTT